MRQLTAFASYFDNLGALLVGRARFYNMDGSPAEVFSRDSQGHYITAGSSVFTNSSGQLVPQVFLENHDYLIVFDKYVGDGTMSEDTEEESWEEQGSAVDQYNVLGVELEAGASRSVSTIAVLRETESLYSNEVVLLQGYNASGDVEPVYYKWKSSSTDNDNGGSVIKVEDVAQGRWVLVDCPDYLDVRHFGAFPKSGIEEDSVQRNAIQLAYDYAHSMGKGIYFGATGTAIYYDISGLTLIRVDSHPDARVFAKDGMPASISIIKEVYCENDEDYSGLITLTGETVKTSWGADCRSVLFSPGSELIMDAAIQSSSKSWSDIYVEVRVYTSGCAFEGCNISSLGKIDDSVAILNCELKSSWFTDDYDWSKLNSISNRILLKNFDRADDYIVLKNKQYESDYGDMEGNTITGKTLLPNCLIENVDFSGVTIAASSSISNASGTISQLGTQPNANWVDCWFTITDLEEPFGSLQIRRGSLSSSVLLEVNGTAFLKDVEINNDIQAYNLQMFNCDVSAKAGIVCSNGSLTGKIQYNKFFNNGYLAVKQGNFTTGVVSLDILITGNYSDHDFWDDSDFDDVVHSTTGRIVYEENHGGCPGNEARAHITPTFDIVDRGASIADNTIQLVKKISDSSPLYKEFWWRLKLNYVHNFDSLGIWHCKKLRYYRTIEFFTKILPYLVDNDGNRYQFNFEMVNYVLLNPPAETETQSGTWIFEWVASVPQYYSGGDTGWINSALANGLDNLLTKSATIVWDYRAR